MLRVLARLLLAVGGAAAATIVVALIEARAVAAGGNAGIAASSLFVAELGVLFPIAMLVGGGVGVAALVLDPGDPTSPVAMVSALRAGSAHDRLRRATLAPLAVLVVFAWCVASAHAARSTLAVGSPGASGLATSVASIGAFAGLALLAVAAAPLLRRGLALASAPAPQLLDPALTGGVALVLVLFLFAIGIASGDTGGDGGVAGLGIFGVLKRAELDLRPVANLVVIALGAWLAPMPLARRKVEAAVGAAAAAGMALALFVLCLHAGSALDADPVLARSLEKDAPLGKISLAVVRKATDRDHDGFSARFGGGDCNDRDNGINPGAIDVPGNGIDEDCSGADTPPPVVDTDAQAATATDAGKPSRTYNVVLITVDTLRADNLGFAGYAPPVSPNLDALANKSVVFERAYSLASYTGKAVGPMLIGRYPSECARNFSHFDTYFPSNVFLAERLHDAGIRTFAGHCHWYFKNPTGLSQGFDVWNTSAIPPGMGDNDNTVTSDRESDLAIELLGKTENTKDRFFAWFHYFDPHAQYVAHPGAPDFAAAGEKNPTRAAYDGEVWFTDKHIGRVLDFIRAEPWAKDTAVIVTADHGETFGEHGMAWHGREIWEPLVRVPLVVYLPDQDAKRIPVKRSAIDLAPTILELLGVDAPPATDAHALRGKSLLGDVRARDPEALEERDVLVDMPAGPFNEIRRAVIYGKTPGTKIIHFGVAYYNVFDLAEDPNEKNDLSSDKAKLAEAKEHLAAMRSRLTEFPVKRDDEKK